MYLLGLLILVVGLVISVALHEIGHMVPAKKFGAMVPEYYVGFGPTLYSKRVGQTRYGIKAIPLGGYVRILGMFPPPTTQPKANARGQLTLADQAREQSAEELAAAREDGIHGKPFYQLRTYQKLIIMFGGPVMNLVLAVLLTLVIVLGIGWREATTTVAEVSEAGPAAVAGVQPGDRVVAWNGQETPNWDSVRQAVGSSTEHAGELTVIREGQTRTITVTPEVVDGVGRLGILAEEIRVRGSLSDAAESTWQMLTGTASALINLPVSLWNLATGLFSDAPRDPNGALSVVGVARVAGEITAAPSDGGWHLADRAALLLSLLASLNIALFVFNLIPLPPLDGGHIAGAAWGGLKNGWARMRGKPRPVPVDTARLVPLSYGVFVVLMGLTLLLVIADFVKPLQLFG